MSEPEKPKRRFWQLHLSIVLILSQFCIASAEDVKSDPKPIELPDLPKSIQAVVKASEGGSLLWTQNFRDALADKEADKEIPLLQRFIRENPDSKSFLLLYFLKSKDVKYYEKVDSEVKIKILVSELKNVSFLNDWGVLDEESDSDSEVAKDLIGLGKQAIPFLIPLLKVHKSAYQAGSEASSESISAGVRRCDYAYRYICKILGRKPIFRKGRSNRNDDIEELTNDLLKASSNDTPPKDELEKGK